MPSNPLDRAEVCELLCALIRAPSVNPALAPGEGTGEAEVAAVARAWLSARGVSAKVEEAAAGRPNVIAEVGEGDGATLLLCGHLDTVSAEGMTIPAFEPRAEGSRVYGRGSYDMKGGVAAIMAAAAALAEEGVAGRVLVALVADEEHASLGAFDAARRYAADGCIVTEPSQNEVILAHKGFVWAELVTTGTAAHGSRWEDGVSAIGRMGRVIAALETFDRKVLRARTHPLVGPASLHCAQIDGGAGASTYAPRCRLQVERRTLPGEEPEQVLGELERVAIEAGEEVEVRLLLDRPPLTCDAEAAVVRALRGAATEVQGEVPAETGVAYWMDAAVFGRAGIPTVGYGPAGQGAHAAIEWVDLDSVVSCARTLAATARRFCR